MIVLTARQADALTELVNIAFGLTAAKLSEISGYRVLLESPTVAVHPMDALATQLGSLVSSEVATVHQLFTGSFAGDAILFLNFDDALTLSNLLVEKHLRSQRFDVASAEILTEVGNMLLSACLGMFGNLLQVHVTFSIPRLRLDSVEHLITSISVGDDELIHAILITAPFKISGQGVDGRIVIILGISSLERLIKAVEAWEESQDSA